MKKCANCGKTIRWVEFGWFHTWWVQDPEFGATASGSTECAWRGRPNGQLMHAEPVVEEATAAVGSRD